MTTDNVTYGRQQGRGKSGHAAFFSSAALVLLVSGGLGTAAYLLLMRTGRLIWGLAAGFGWFVAALTLIGILLGVYVAVINARTIRRYRRGQGK